MFDVSKRLILMCFFFLEINVLAYECWSIVICMNLVFEISSYF